MREPKDLVHWEEIVRTMLEQLGAEGFAELIDYVLEQDQQLMDMDEPPTPLGTIH